MKRLLYLLIVVFPFISCKKDIQDDLLQDENALNAKVSSDNVNPVPAPSPYEWYSLSVPTDVDGHLTGTYNQVIEVNGAVYSLLGFGVYKSLYKFNPTTKKWARSTDFGIYPDSRILFAYQTKIYIGLSNSNNTILNDFKSFDLTTGITTTLSPFPGTGVSGATYFVIGNKGYLLGGETFQDNNYNQFWEYNFTTNQWTNRGNSPLGARVDATAFVIDNKAYLGFGYDYITLNGIKIPSYKNDWVLWDPASGFSITKATYPGLRRKDAAGFVINNYPYVGFGRNASTKFNDFYKYNSSSNTWIQQSDWPGDVTNGFSSQGFSTGNKGYIVKGALDQFWVFSNSPVIVIGKQ